MTQMRVLFFLVAAIALGACSQKTMVSPVDAGSGGASSTGGAVSSGGASSTGGGPGRGGANASGGAPGMTGGTGGGDQGGGGAGGTMARIPTRHRADHVACGMNPTPTAATCTPVGAQGTADSTCTLDAQCTEGANGRCVQYSIVETDIRCRCTYTQCQTDQDCRSGGACRCGGSEPNAWGNTCLEGNCQVDADCGPGGFCSPTRARDTPRAQADRPTAIVGTFCHTSDDDCVNDEDCPPSGFGLCAYTQTQHRWTCIDFVGQ